MARSFRIRLIATVALGLGALSLGAGAYELWPQGGSGVGSPSSRASAYTAARAAADAGSRAPAGAVSSRQVRSGAAAARSGPGRRGTTARASARSARATGGKALAASSVTINLCAKQGSIGLPGNPSMPIWGFAQGPCATAAAATLPGPALAVDQGDAVTLVLEVDPGLSQSVTLALPGQNVSRSGGTYSFTASRPGTFLYEAGGLDAPRQVAMGLYGSLVVRSSTAGQAYGTSATAFDSDAVLVLSEIDPNLNANPSGFDLLDYAPTYWLINGKAYPQTDEIAVAAGAKVLLRYVNAGLSNHTMELLGAQQREVAKDAFPTSYPVDLVSETFAAGSTADLIVTVPSAAPGTRFPLFNRQLHLTNGDAFPGGMLTFLTVAPGP